MADTLKQFLIKETAGKKPAAPVKPAAPKKALSFDDPNYGKPAPFDPAYNQKTQTIAKQQSAYDVGAAARANAKAAKMPKKTPAKGGAGYIGIGGKKG